MIFGDNHKLTYFIRILTDYSTFFQGEGLLALP